MGYRDKINGKYEPMIFKRYGQIMEEYGQFP